MAKKHRAKKNTGVSGEKIVRSNSFDAAKVVEKQMPKRKVRSKNTPFRGECKMETAASDSQRSRGRKAPFRTRQAPNCRISEERRRTTRRRRKTRSFEGGGGSRRGGAVTKRQIYRNGRLTQVAGKE